VIELVVRDGARVSEHAFERESIHIGTQPRCDLVVRGERKDQAYVYGNEVDGFTLTDVKRNQSRRIAVGEQFTVGVATIELRVRPPVPYAAAEPAERELLAAIAGGDDTARPVYADWLEQRGDGARAEFLRVQQQILGATGDTPEFHAQMTRLRELAQGIDVMWRVAIARPFVEGCVGFQAPCPREWAAMAPTERSDVRFCGGCHKQVFYCTTIERARSHALRGHCIAVDAALVRTPGDLASHPPMPGAPVAGPQ
jgi:uncharacterized protein (TIGR02996 family)